MKHVPNSSVSTSLNHTIQIQEELYQNFLVLNRVGQEITSTRDFEVIFERLYRHVNALMDASVFCIDIYKDADREIEYKFSIEKSERLPPVTVSIDDETSLSAWCIRNQKEIIISDVESEIHEYIPKIEILAGEATNSILYVPLMMEGKIIGAISAQSFEKGAYTSYHQLILKTLASYAAVALSNAYAYEMLQKAVKEIEYKQASITDSLHYARRIQEAILPDLTDIRQAFPDFFIFYRPRDIVSGDFYWFSSRNEQKIIAVVDCTGHGVPGAFMSVLGSSLLNQIVNEKHITEPDEILNRLNASVRATLKQVSPESSTNDGMDIGICTVDTANKRITFAGANRPLFYIQNGQTHICKGDKHPIGGWHATQPYTANTFVYDNGFTFYLATDGFADQFGGANKRKFLNSRFKLLLGHISHHEMIYQAHLLSESFRDWKGSNDQLDDVLVIGIRLE